MHSHLFRFTRSRSAPASLLINRSHERERVVVSPFDLLRSHERKRVVSRSARLASARRYGVARLSLVLGLTFASPLFAQGIISSTVDLNHTLKGERPPGAAKAAAAVADVATAPVQVPLFLFAKARDEREKAEIALVQEQIARIKQDPDYIFQHRLHLTVGHKGLTALLHSLRDPAVPFTDAQLRRLHREMGSWGWRVYTHPACSREFLEESWKHYCATVSKFDPVILHHFSLNPNLPDEWLERVARGEAKASSPGCQEDAKSALYRRHAQRQAQLAATAVPTP